jgi:ATP-binding cassette subfamily F protein 3
VNFRRPNLLLLDEPTNHLDLEMRQALAVALQDYAGAVVLVSHDRHLLRAVADELLLVDRGAVAPFEGDLEDYAKWFTTREAAETEQSSGSNASAEQRRQRKREEAERRNRLSPLRAQVAQLEARLEQIESRSREIETELASPDLYRESSKSRLQELLQTQGELQNERGAVEAAWLSASEALEQALAAEM